MTNNVPHAEIVTEFLSLSKRLIESPKDAELLLHTCVLIALAIRAGHPSADGWDEWLVNFANTSGAELPSA